MLSGWSAGGPAGQSRVPRQSPGTPTNDRSPFSQPHFLLFGELTSRARVETSEECRTTDTERTKLNAVPT